jgi:hypothetical protein
MEANAPQKLPAQWTLPSTWPKAPPGKHGKRHEFGWLLKHLTFHAG